MGGGVLTYLENLSSQLTEEFDVFIAYGRRTQTPANLESQFSGKVKLIPVNSFRRNINPIRDFMAMVELSRLISQINPDIVHLHSSKAGFLGRILSMFYKAKFFYTPHGYSFLMKNVSSLRRVAYRMLELIASKSKTITISCSKGEFCETQKFSKHSLYVSNGIDTNEIDRLVESYQPLSIAEKSKKRVFTIGRICTQKNPSLFNQIALSLPEYDFVWIGDGELRKELSAPNIQITGWLSRREVIRQVLLADIFVLPSLWEGLPISLLEAMYLGKPCVVSNVIGSRDVIHNGENGYVCETLSEYISVIRKIQAEKPETQIRHAKRDILTQYNIKSMSKKYVDIYRGAEPDTISSEVI